MSRFLSSSVKRAVKGRLKKLRIKYVRWRHGFNADQFSRFLVDLGVRKGDVLLVHSAMDCFVGFDGRATQIIQTLQQLLGPEGTLIMPTLSFSGTAVEYVKSNPVFDVRRTPSRTGMLTELFRRMPGVVRSVHPTHSVAAWGACAESMIADHHACNTPCGRQSPFGRLLDVDGRILFLGPGIEVMTFFHTIEEIMEAKWPMSPFTKEAYQLNSRDADGELLATETRLFDRVLSRRRDMTCLKSELLERGAWKHRQLGILPGILLNAGEVLQTVQSMSARGVYCYAD
jgi:aminoglycoside 3-N-acetyltransferase